MRETILVVDDEAPLRRALEKYLTGEGYHVVTAENAEAAMAAMLQGPIHCALVDLMLPGRNGIELIGDLRGKSPETVAIVMTGFGTISGAVDAMKAGAFHYLTKPFELEDIKQLVFTALEHRRLKMENRELRRTLSTRYQFNHIIGQSEAMQGVFRLIEKLAETDSTVLLLGESGTGKELVARAIHFNSPRAKGPLIAVNCAAIPDDLLESELFGHMRGSFTGATTTQTGKFEAAHGGTIFLDEIGDMSPKLQVKLLRVLQERRIEPVGSTRSQDIDVRIITATNQDLEIAVREKRFREDLFYRLNVIPVKVPPLRERDGDIPLLIDHFLARFNKANERDVQGFTAEAMTALLAHKWPGNVRELENLLERLVVLRGKGEITIADLPAMVRSPKASYRSPVMDIPEAGISFKAAVDEFENSLILQALHKTNGNKNKAASLLKLNRTTLVEKIKKKQLGKTPEKMSI